jgi:hypothetical protein
MANFVSPGVYTVEKDVSDYAPSVNPSIVGLVGFASRGPTNKATLVTSPAELLRTFGTPDLVTGGQGVYGALEILQKTNQVYYVRAVTTTALDARNGLSFGTQPHCCIKTTDMYENFVYRFDFSVYDKVGGQVGEETSVYAYRERPYVSGAGGSLMPTTPSASWTDSDWHNALIAGTGDAFDATNGLVSYIPSAYGQASGMFVANTAGAGADGASRLEVKTYVATGLVDNYGTDTYLSATPIDPTELTFHDTWTGATPALVTDARKDVFLAPSGDDSKESYDGAFSSVLVGANPWWSNTDGDPARDGTGSPSAGFAASGASFLTSGDAGAYQIASLYPGLGYNYSAIPYTGGIQYRGLQAAVTKTNDQGRFVLNIRSDGAAEESYDMRIAKPGSTVSATSLYPEDVLTKGVENANSNYVKGNLYTYEDATNTNGLGPTEGVGTVSGITTWTAPSAFGETFNVGTNNVWVGGGTPATTTRTATAWRCVTVEPGVFSLSKGNNGDAADYNGNMTNSNVRSALIGKTGAKTGIYALDQEDVPVTLAAVPGVTDQNVQNTLTTLAESTQNFLAVTAPPLGFQSAQQAIAWSNGQATGRTASINSSYTSVYWPWVKAFDAYTGLDRWYDPSIYAIAQMCFTDEVADPWFAPAGLTRGRLTKPTDVEVKLNQGDRDALYGPGNIVNPITKFTTDGIVIYGQRTGQRAATALDRINVRRLMIYLRRLVLQSARRFVFEPNDPITWESVRNVISPALADIQQRRGLVSFQVVCDSTTNTPLRVDRNELWCKIILKPTKTAEILVFELNLTNQSASV